MSQHPTERAEKSAPSKSAAYLQRVAKAAQVVGQPLPRVESARQARILVVDDNRSIVRIIEGVLQHDGYQVTAAFDGLEAVEKARESKPHLIILDILMPRLDGYQVCRALQQHPETSHIPILLLSVTGQLDDPDLDDTARAARLQERMDGFEAGASDFLSKPVKAKELEERIKMLLWFSGI